MQTDPKSAQFSEIRMSPDLLPKILSRIRQEQKIIAIRKLIFSGMAFCAMVILSIPTWGRLAADLARSGFGQYASLIVSDFGAILASWREYVTLLLESLPVESLILTLLLAAGGLISLRMLGRYTKFLSGHFYHNHIHQ